MKRLVCSRCLSLLAAAAEARSRLRVALVDLASLERSMRADPRQIEILVRIRVALGEASDKLTRGMKGRTR